MSSKQRIFQKFVFFGLVTAKNEFCNKRADFQTNHKYNKILKSDWLSTVLISALIGQCNRTVCAIPRACLNGFFFTASQKKTLGFSCVSVLKKA